MDGENAVPRLTITVGRLSGHAFDVPPGRTTIGRTYASMIVIADSTVDPEHAELVRSGARVALTDLASTNDTRVNEQPVDSWRELRDGDVVRLGSVELRFAAGAGQDRDTSSYSFGRVQVSVSAG